VGVYGDTDGGEGLEERVAQLEGEEEEQQQLVVVVAEEEAVVVLVVLLEEHVGPSEEQQQNDHSYHYPAWKHPVPIPSEGHLYQELILKAEAIK
jgi:hypothetical protein